MSSMTIYVCSFCGQPIARNEPTRVDRGKFFHIQSRNCHGEWIAQQNSRQLQLPLEFNAPCKGE